MPRTSKQVLAEQKQQADATAHSKPAQLPATRKAALPATPDHRSPRQRYLDEVAPSGIVGRLVKFDGKEGKFFFADTEETISDAEDFVVLADQTLVAFVKFQPDSRRCASAACSTPRTSGCRRARSSATSTRRSGRSGFRASPRTPGKRRSCWS